FLSNLTVFFIVAMACHGELARSRPSADHLTEFYLWMSAGGLLGGIFNALIAPLVFTSIAEYPIVYALAAFLIPLPGTRNQGRQGTKITLLLDILLPVLLGALGFWLIAKWPLWNVDIPMLNKLP